MPFPKKYYAVTFIPFAAVFLFFCLPLIFAAAKTDDEPAASYPACVKSPAFKKDACNGYRIMTSTEASDGVCYNFEQCQQALISMSSTSCTDTDGGKDYAVKGTVKEGAEQFTEYTDVCMPVSVANPQGHLLMERSCNGFRIQNEFYNCPNGCADGACLEEQPSIECEGEDCPVEPKAKQTFTVYAGVEVYYKNSAFEVTGEASDLSTGLSEPLDMRWLQVSGPRGGKVTFSNAKCLVPSFAAYCKTTISATKDGVYKIRLKVVNPKKISSSDDFALVWDTTAPVLKEVKKIPSIGSDPNPTVTFSSTAINAVSPVYNRYGDIIYGGACQGHGTSAKQGNNVIELLTLTDGTYDDCTIQVVDIAGNMSKVLKISKFTIDTLPPTPPVMDQPGDNITDPSYTITGTKEAGTSVWWGNKQIVKHNADTSWKYKVKLNIGENKFVIFTEDAADTNSEKVTLIVTLQKPVCTSWTYGGWGKCDDNQQTRRIFSASPRKCAGGEPVVSRDCKAEKNKPLCESYIYSAWGKCLNNKKIRAVESAFPADCRGGVGPELSGECGKEFCDFVNYTTWSSCDAATGKKTRQIESTSPEVCVVQNPVLSMDCNGCESYNYSAWSACVDYHQTRTVESTLPADCHGGVQPVVSQECGKKACDFVYYTAWSACNKTTGKRTRQVESTVPKICTVENPELEKDCNACESYNYSAWSTCVNNKQTRTVTSTLPADCSGGVQPELTRECGKGTCDFVYYTAWSACNKTTGKRTRQVESTVPKICVVDNPELEKDCNACESYIYSMWSACVNNRQTRTVESTFPEDCSGGVPPVLSRECGKDACDYVYYTAWSACDQSTGMRTRQIESTVPAVCVPQSPLLSKECNACESYIYSMWSACVNNQQTRTVEIPFPADCHGGAEPLLSRECGKEFCDFVYYTAWSKCDKSTGKRTRQVESTVPAVCVPENPWLEKDCDLCESYNYSAWSKCDASGIQHRTLETDPTVSPTFPADCYGGAQPVYTRTCPPCDSWIFSAWSTCSGGQQTRTIDHATYPPDCWGGSPQLTRSCS
ncbi:MAG: hypothetical protein PHI63_01440 [Patescibacteria group bacterium]|nr:hypothetical protein [Patescibacteria group bacterium]